MPILNLTLDLLNQTLKRGPNNLCFSKFSVYFLRIAVLWPDFRFRNFHRPPEAEAKEAELRCLCPGADPGKRQEACTDIQRPLW